MKIRAGAPGDVPAALALYDAAVRWLVARGRGAQWGTEPFSTSLVRSGQVTRWAEDGQLWIAETGGVTAGAVALTPAAPPYVQPAGEPEIYIHGLVTSRAHTGRGIGRALLDHARAEAADRGIHLVRVDCWAGGDGALIRYYEHAGFTPVSRFTFGTWEGQVLQARVGS